MSQIDKTRIACSFSKAAKTYDAAAAFQRDVGEELLKLISTNKILPDNVLDLGCGTGFFSEKLLQVSPSSQVFGLDLAQGMLKHAKELRTEQRVQWLCADAENLPFKNQSFDLIFSSLTVQWCENLPKLFSEIYRVLKPGGEAIISTLGPQSLCELKEAWACVDKNVHVNRFISLASILDSVPAGFDTYSIKNKWLLEYDYLKELTSDLKNIGAHNMNHGESKGLTGRQKILAFKRNYERNRQSNGKLPASYEVFFLKLTKN